MEKDKENEKETVEETAEKAEEASAEKAAEESVKEETPEDENKKKYDALNEKYMRTLAEYDNYRKRSIRERESIYPEAKADAVASFLPVMDNLERALGIETERNSFYEGVELVKKQLDEVFAKLGVEAIEASAGTAFDPQFHNAVMHVEDESLEENVIVEEFQKGYRIGERIIRHSMVKVAN